MLDHVEKPHRIEGTLSKWGYPVRQVMHEKDSPGDPPGSSESTLRFAGSCSSQLEAMEIGCIVAPLHQAWMPERNLLRPTPPPFSSGIRKCSRSCKTVTG